MNAHTLLTAGNSVLMRRLLLGIILMFLASCSTGTDATPELSHSEVSSLVEVLVNESLPLGDGTRPCSAGGEVTQDVGFPTADLTYDGCRGISYTGLEFTIDGEVTVLSANSFETLLTGLISSWSGTVSWGFGDRTGSCVIDLRRFRMSIVQGSVCGTTIDLSV